jgi:hypothetical protein
MLSPKKKTTAKWSGNVAQAESTCLAIAKP